MKKSIKIVSVGLVLGVMFVAGSFTQASNDWVTTVIGEANRSIGQAGHQKKEEIINSDVTAQKQQAIQPAIDAEEEELQRLLEEYYQMKLQGLTETEEFQEIKNQLLIIREGVFERYKSEIDSMFE